QGHRALSEHKTLSVSWSHYPQCLAITFLMGYLPARSAILPPVTSGNFRYFIVIYFISYKII
ncbi:hypothetical protein PSY65_16940, partial [Shigella flexneri]|nr:hypothetical protein [Shigella flexneri]MDD0251906.1 hypothetical protein [Shigella flexneri]MDD0285404.1 hypothetical protein [Shigella flexneri]MDD0446493.1 hypothetical protein [Shigella sonnei]